MPYSNDEVRDFWAKLAQDAETNTPKLRPPIRDLPPVPVTGWKPPSVFPDLSGAAMIAIDCETKDPDLLDKGPGPRRGAHIVGLAVGVPDGGRWYFPMRHEVGASDNLDPAKVLAWAAEQLSRTNQPKVGANLGYDLDFLWHEGVPVAGPFWDVQVAEPLIDENQFTFALSALGRKYLGEDKKGDTLRTWVEHAYRTTGEAYRGQIWRSPPSLVGPYAEGDVDLPLRIFEKQRVIMEQEELMPVFQVETDLLPLLVKMRQRGVRVDVPKARLLDDELTKAIGKAQAALNSAGGGFVDVAKAASLQRLFDRENVVYPKTDKGNASFPKEWLEHYPHPACKLVVEVRTLTKLRDTFVRGYVLNQHINGRIYCQFHQSKTDDNGTVSGRLSSSTPNLQNIPSRHPYWGPQLRSLFVPEEGELWGRHDWSQIEYRFLAHYGIGPNSVDVRRMYNEDATTDFHSMVMAMTGLDRKPAKTVNFGLCYGMGPEKLAFDLGLSLEEATRTIFEPYHARVPFVKMTYDRATARAQERGYIRTIMGRRARFSMFESANWSKGGERNVLPFDQAKSQWGTSMKRAYTHKALNRLLQGSAADLMKKAMVDVASSGVPGVVGVPLLTVHDELGHSFPNSKEGQEAMLEVKRIMETCLELNVPIIAEQEIGKNWGDC